MSRVRIIGGCWRRRLISVSDASGLRPTPDAVRETLFNWLGQDLSGLCCLDLFAGSGVLGFEAASRGAERVTLVERDPRVVNRLRENDRLLGAGVEIIRGDGLKFTSAAGCRYDVLFLDPPYRQGYLERIAPKLPALLADNARIYAEAEFALERLGEWVTVKNGRCGQVHYQLLERS